jgi:hypothetical protein
MKDIPGVAWVVGGFVILATALFFYSRTGPAALPIPESAWTQVDTVREGIRTRKIDLKVGESRDEVSQPYRLMLRRLKDLEGGAPMARYLLEIRPLSSQLLKDSWLGAGMNVAFLDLQPTEPFGLLRLVSFRKVDQKL